MADTSGKAVRVDDADCKEYGRLRYWVTVSIFPSYRNLGRSGRGGGHIGHGRVDGRHDGRRSSDWKGYGRVSQTDSNIPTVSRASYSNTVPFWGVAVAAAYALLAAAPMEAACSLAFAAAEEAATERSETDLDACKE